MKLFSLLTIFVLVSPLTNLAAEDLSLLKTEELIDRLQQEASPGVGTNPTAWAEGFMATNEVPKFTGGIIGSPQPTVSPIMRELVCRGLKALPQLIDHLSDARATKLVVGNGFMGKWFADEYQPRYPEADRQPKGVNTGNRTSFDQYTLKVGDLCFVAIGQIVDRDYNAVRYQPSLCLVVNSPVEMPLLAAAVKADWIGLTPNDHQNQLEDEATHPSNHIWPGALKRLIFYYPKWGMTAAQNLMERPLYNLAGFGSEVELVEALDLVHSEALDQSAYRELQRTAAAHPDSVDGIYARCELAGALMKYLAKPDQADDVKNSYKEMMSRFPRPPESATMDLFSRQFNAFLDKKLQALAPK